jgi:hypothetical protein
MTKIMDKSPAQTTTNDNGGDSLTADHYDPSSVSGLEMESNKWEDQRAGLEMMLDQALANADASPAPAPEPDPAPAPVEETTVTATTPAEVAQTTAETQPQPQGTSPDAEPDAYEKAMAESNGIDPYAFDDRFSNTFGPPKNIPHPLEILQQQQQQAQQQQPEPAPQEQSAAANEAATETAETPAEPAPPEEEREPGNKRYRIRPNNEVDARAFELRYEEGNEFKPMEELIAMAKAELDPDQVQTGTDGDGTAHDESISIQPYPDFDGLSPDQLASKADEFQLESVRLQNEANRMTRDFEDEDEVDAKMKAAEEALEKSLSARRQIEVVQQQQIAFNTDEAKTFELYPELDDDGSEFRARFDRVAQGLAMANDPLLNDPQRSQKIAGMVAMQLGNEPRTAPPTNPAPVQQQQPASPLKQPVPVSQRPLSTMPGQRAAAPAPAPGGAGNGAQTPSTPNIDLANLPVDEAEWARLKESLGYTSF